MTQTKVSIHRIQAVMSENCTTNIIQDEIENVAIVIGEGEYMWETDSTSLNKKQQHSKLTRK